MTETLEKELKELKDRAAFHVQRYLAKNPGQYVLTSVLYNSCGRGLPPSVWADVLVQLCETGICTARRQGRNGSMYMALGIHPASHGGPAAPTSNLAIANPSTLSVEDGKAVEQLVAAKQ